MEANIQQNAHDPVVSFNRKGKVVVNKDAPVSKKLIARRAIEAHLEHKRLERDIENYCFD